MESVTQNMINKTHVLVASLAVPLYLAGCGTNGESNANETDNYPTKPIHFIVPYAAGGSSDGAARVLADIVNEQSDARIVVENRPGAGALIGTSEVANSPADGYKALMGTIGTLTTTIFNTPDVTYSPKDFEGVAGIAEAPLIFVASKQTGWKSTEDISSGGGPSSIKYGITGPGNAVHIAQAAMFAAADREATAVPFDSNAETLRGVLGGQLQSAAVELNIGLPAIKAGKVTPLAVTSEERLDQLPEVPTTGELGNECAVSSSYAVLVPKGTPEPAVKFFREATLNAADSTEYKDFLEKGGLLPSDNPKGDDWMAFVDGKGKILKDCLAELKISVGE